MAAPPFKVKAVYEYTSEHDDDLKFPIGQIINVVELEGDDWYVGEYTDAAGAHKEGLFPSNFVERYEPAVPVRPTRAARPKSVQSPPVPESVERGAEEDVPPLPAASKPQAPLVDTPAEPPTVVKEEAPLPPQPTAGTTPTARAEPPPAPKPAHVEPAQTASTPSKAGPPPVAPKSNAFKDRIAAFNKTEQAPLAPIGPGRQQPRNDYIKKPFVAPPPSSNAYVPPAQKAEPVHRPYIREEDPEIKQRQEDDRAAAEAAGLTGEWHTSPVEEDEDAPKPMSLKERMAMLQREQEAARTRQAETSHKKERKPPAQKPAEHVEGEEAEDAGDELERVSTTRQSMEVPRERPRVPSAQRRPVEPMSPVHAVPAHEILSGGEEADQSAAGETTEDDTGTTGPEDSDDRPAPLLRAPAAPMHEPDVGDEEGVADEEDEEDELDEEEQRKQRLRERMARLAGGQQGGGPFNPFGMPATAAPTKKRSTKEKAMSEEGAPPSAPQIPQMVAIPGMGGAPPPTMQSPKSDQTQRAFGLDEQQAEDDDDEARIAPPRRAGTDGRSAPPPMPTDRSVPPAPNEERVAPSAIPSESSRPTPRPPPIDARPVPPPPPVASIVSPGPGSESDDEMSMHAKRSSAETSGVETPLPIRTAVPPVLPSRDAMAEQRQSPSSATSEKRASRLPPPIPGDSPVTSRPPPPLPPSAPISRQVTDLQSQIHDETERGESDYEGDYDTDIASSVKHKDALKSHVREPSLDDSTTADEMPPSLPHAAAPQPPATRAVPPLPPVSAPRTRPSMDTPRAPPPVPPPTRDSTNDDYDPYTYESRAPPPVPSAVPVAAPPVPPDNVDIQEESSADDVPPPAAPPPTRKSMDRPPPPPPAEIERPPPMPPIAQPAPPPPARAPTQPRQSMDVQRTGSVARRSLEQGRSAGEMGRIAHDIDLAHHTHWWTASQPLPPQLQSRNGIEILSESEESQKSKRGGRTTISKDVYILYMDYSQTVITAQYDSKDPADVILEQRHEPPPSKLRQDQLEAYWQRFGSKIAHAANAAGNSKKDKDTHVFGDGSPAALPYDLIRSLPDALLPVGTRAYGALVYANLANASTQQFDEIRPGDIITLRNGKFEGHHGAMRQKYKVEYGVFHVAVVEEWDGTRRSVRAWEQGREQGKKGGVRSEKFRLGDLRSGEVRVWRVVGRDWVGWEN
ncbi:hypothetical protein BAUCODRAFT_37014 [Baudoinia panamericana UAMH 10762]|uniref:SH3 domain-containing protein n=1 Tax=Baudoinia panamericana (strain UAMH 10762) TaxID=717646 RepID=M2LGU1_BAUPA|nr:uncharacterized protein BAUCODRAFT_37014 [Baudoinia panamericana UAMH 10762]EMC93327.1 hypothetical protein BAUCODRAFT_37014 [Baudoinia panamericana UAMH 10762]